MNYLIYNTRHEQLYMADYCGYTEDLEFAGIFSEEDIRKRTGMFDTRTGDYANTILIEFSTLNMVDIKEKYKKLNKSQRQALKSIITEIKRIRFLPLEPITRKNEICCPYCKKPLFIKDVSPLRKVCKLCKKPIETKSIWEELEK